jgi:hypothetical protein
MTDDSMALLKLIEKGADADLIRELLACAGHRLMAAEFDQLTGAPAGVRSRSGSTAGTATAIAAERHASAASSSPSRSSGRLLRRGLPGAAPHGGEGAQGGHPGGVRARRLDRRRGRPRQGDSGGGVSKKPSLAPVRRDQRTGPGFPHPPDRVKLGRVS